MKKRIHIITLGCSKNVVDSEHLAAQLPGGEWQIVFDGDAAGADVVVVNTCGFIGDAKEESVNTTLEFARAKEEGLIGNLFVIGCLSERYRDDLKREMPEVDRYFGVHDMAGIVEALGSEYRDSLRTDRRLSTPSHYAYLKISEGCDRRCGFCAIPSIRGRHISIPEEVLVEEAEKLAGKGVRELIVIAQDVTWYGLDLYGERRLAALLKKLAAIENIHWIRLHYAYPAHFPQDVIDVLREEPKLCKYLDIPFQHISNAQLRAMRRGYDRNTAYALIEKLRREIPDITLRTTLLTGYPDESEQDFEELLQFVRDGRFERLGVFPYSEEENTYSAQKLKDNIPQDVKEERAERIMALQNEISRELNEARAGSVREVVIDRREGDLWVGRTRYDSPEVDGEVLIVSETPLKPGQFLQVEITGAEDYDLFARPAGDQP